MIKRKDLTDIGDKNYNIKQGEYMECQECGEVIGGTRGDYWQCPMDHVFVCPDCGSDDIALCRLQRKSVILKR
jgi:predicted RNA-binding Zn-ribbon protein involved in translation (DUF1610 family)